MTEKRLRVFYSWQSDRPNGVCRGFIQKALDLAAKEDGLPETLIDRDTQGVPGTPDIADVILEKIDACDVFVADITLVTPADAARPAPNPNVLFELGYAVKSISWSRILLVMNEAYGAFDKLPFDLGRTRRKPITYSLNEGQEERESVRTPLVKVLAEALRTVAMNAGRGELVSRKGTADIASEALRSRRADAVAKLASALRTLHKTLVRYVAAIEWAGGPTRKEKAKAVDEAVAFFDKLYDDNRVLLPKEAKTDIEGVRTRMWEIASRFARAQRLEELGRLSEEEDDYWGQCEDAAGKEIGPRLDALEDQLAMLLF